MTSYFKMRKIIFCLILLGIICGCSSDQTIHAYVVVRPSLEDRFIYEWRPVMRVTYKVEENKVVSEIAGLLDEYQDCNIQDKSNWECQYEDGRGNNKFGFKNGKFWEKPNWGEEIKHVSRWEFNMIRCKWYQHESGSIKGMINCLQTYI